MNTIDEITYKAIEELEEAVSKHHPAYIHPKHEKENFDVLHYNFYRLFLTSVEFNHIQTEIIKNKNIEINTLRLNITEQPYQTTAEIINNEIPIIAQVMETDNNSYCVIM